MVIDSDVLIWYFRGNQNAKNLIDTERKIFISAVSYMELMQGMKNKSEMAAFEKLLKEKNIKVIEISKRISKQASSFVKQYVLSNSLGMGDALIAATCTTHKKTLCTGNVKHFKCIPNLKVEVFRA